MHVGARHYSPSLRRWLQRDPIDLLGGHPNLYVYALGDPVGSVDPSGLVIYLLPGTFQRGRTDVFPRALIEEISRALHRAGDLCHVFHWGNKDRSDWPFESNWRTAAKDLASSLARYYKTQARSGEPIWIVGYSHGGTVALLASQMLAEQGIPVEGIVLLGTPLVYADEKGNPIAPGATTKGVWLVYEYMDITEGVAGTFSAKDLGQVAEAWGSGGFEGTLGVVLFGDNTRGTGRFETHGCYLNTDVWKKHITPRMKVGR
jgi:pimeloyl-ACP methyl ester carboxylesterase